MQPSMEQWIEELLSAGEMEQKVTEKQAKIILAAVETFSEKGYAATSTSEIAQKAGVAEGTIFRHYKTKKDLLLSIVAPVMTRLIGPIVLRDFTKMLDTPYDTYEDFLRALFHNRLEFAKKHLSILKILIQEIPFHGELKETFLKMAADTVFTRITRAVEHYKEKGMLVDSIPTYSMIRFTASSMIGLIVTMLLILPEKDWNEEQELEYTIRMIMRGIGAPQRGPAG